MPNGQYHGTKKGHGIRIKNPLRLTVEVTILDGNAKKGISPSFSTCRTIKPGAEVWVKVPQPGQYDIKTSIIRYDEVGEVIRLGDGDWQHAPVPGQPVSKQPQPGPVFITESITVDSRRWRTVAEWLVLKGFVGEVRAINIQLTDDCEAQVIFPNTPGKTVRANTTLKPSTPVLLQKGEAVRVKARSKLGNQGTAQVIIQGELHAVPGVPAGVVRGPSAPVQLTEEKPTEKPEETELRSLGELIEDMRKEEEVKV